MMLVPKYVTKKLPPLYATHEAKDPLVVCKFFLPMTRWTWYATEFDGKDRFFGYVVGDYKELGYFSLWELEWFEGPYGLKVERDLYFEPRPLSEIIRLHD